MVAMTWSTGAAGSMVCGDWSTGAAGSMVAGPGPPEWPARWSRPGPPERPLTVEATSGCRSDTGAWIASDRLVTSGSTGGMVSSPCEALERLSGVMLVSECSIAVVGAVETC